jgi:hypothetical protein
VGEMLLTIKAGIGELIEKTPFGVDWLAGQC